MKIKQTFIAEDGTEFDTEYEAVEHDNRLILSDEFSLNSDEEITKLVNRVSGHLYGVKSGFCYMGDGDWSVWNSDWKRFKENEIKKFIDTAHKVINIDYKPLVEVQLRWKVDILREEYIAVKCTVDKPRDYSMGSLLEVLPESVQAQERVSLGFDERGCRVTAEYNGRVSGDDTPSKDMFYVYYLKRETLGLLDKVKHGVQLSKNEFQELVDKHSVHNEVSHSDVHGDVTITVVNVDGQNFAVRWVGHSGVHWAGLSDKPVPCRVNTRLETETRTVVDSIEF